MNPFSPVPARPNRRIILLLGAGAAGLAVAGVLKVGRDPPRSGSRIDALEAHRRARADEITLIDIRTPGEWQQTGIPEDAHAIDMRRQDFVQALTDVVARNPDRPVALICAAGVRSARVLHELQAAGFDGVLDVSEGMTGSAAGPGWLARELPTVSFDASSG